MKVVVRTATNYTPFVKIRHLILLAILLFTCTPAHSSNSTNTLLVDVGVITFCDGASDSHLKSLVGRELRTLGDVQRVSSGADFLIQIQCLTAENKAGDTIGIVYSFVVLSIPRLGIFADLIEPDQKLTATLLRERVNKLRNLEHHSFGIVGTEDAEQRIAEFVVAEFDNHIMVKRREEWRELQDFSEDQ